MNAFPLNGIKQNEKKSRTAKGLGKESGPSLILRMLVCVIISILPLTQLNAQEVPATDTKPSDVITDESALPDDENIEVIQIEANVNDSAMRAFRSGDFELAQIEFRKNARCALRQENSEKAFISGLQNTFATQGAQGVVNSAPNTTGNRGASNSSSSLSSGTGGNAANQSDNMAYKTRSCNDRGYQLYMAGLSYIQLGQLDEAEWNFRKAAVQNKRLYDAHYRLALIFLLQGDSDAAADRLSSLKSLQIRCKDCDAKQEILARVQHIENALSGKIKLR